MKAAPAPPVFSHKNQTFFSLSVFVFVFIHWAENFWKRRLDCLVGLSSPPPLRSTSNKHFRQAEVISSCTKVENATGFPDLGRVISRKEQKDALIVICLLYSRFRDDCVCYCAGPDFIKHRKSVLIDWNVTDKIWISDSWKISTSEVRKVSVNCRTAIRELLTKTSDKEDLIN